MTGEIVKKEGTERHPECLSCWQQAGVSASQQRSAAGCSWSREEIADSFKIVSDQFWGLARRHRLPYVLGVHYRSLMLEMSLARCQVAVVVVVIAHLVRGRS